MVIDQNGLSHINFIADGVIGRLMPSGSRRYYLKDHLGSTRLVKNNYGSVYATFDYYPFGLLMPGRWSQYSYTVEKFTGKELDSELELYYFGMRYLDPALARWFVRDPFASEMPAWSPYSYAFDNPIGFLDPNGMAPVDWIKNLETGEYIWDASVTSAENTPQGFEYVGASMSDVQSHFRSNTSFIGRLFTDPNINYNGWQGEINQKEVGFWGRAENSLIGGIASSLLDAPWVILQQFNPFDKYTTHLSGALATKDETIMAAATTASMGMMVGVGVQSAKAGGFKTIGTFSKYRFKFGLHGAHHKFGRFGKKV